MQIRWLRLLVVFAALWLVACAGRMVEDPDQVSQSQGARSLGHGVDIRRFMPFSKGNELARPDSSPSLRIASEHPRLDGAIALLPVYAAVAQAVYAGLDETQVREFVDCTNTVEAYKRLADGKADIFFGLAPSQEQREYAASKGLTLTETPIGKEAFVFFVHKDNPVRSLTQEQVRAVYSGRIAEWKELGGTDEPILALQRPENSGSYTTMLHIMKGETMPSPSHANQIKSDRDLYNHFGLSRGMADILHDVGGNKDKNAVGYSFRWYAQHFRPSFVSWFGGGRFNIRLLAIDGVDPTPKNIQSGAYSFTVPLLAVTARPLSAQGKNLLDWILGPEGQALLKRVGYVPLQ